MNIFKSLFIITSILSIISLSFFMAVPHAHACSCMAPGTPAESLEGSTAVFSGTVLSVESNADAALRKVTLDVDQVWKGALGNSIAITTPLDSAGCGFEFAVGENYLVYAYGEETLSTNLCSRTHLLADNDPDVAALSEAVANPTPVSPREAETSAGVHSVIIVLGAAIIAIVIYKIATSRRATV